MTLVDTASTEVQNRIEPRADTLSAFAPRWRTVTIRLNRSETLPRWMPYVIGRLTELQRSLVQPDDEIPTPDPAALERSLVELARIMEVDTPTPSVVPTFDGGVMFVWHKAGWDIEVDVGPKETSVWAQRRDGSVCWSGSLDEHVRDVTKVLTTM